MHGNAKEQAEIDSEKEIIETSTVQAMGKNKYGNVTQKVLEEKLNSNAGNDKTEIIDNGDTLVVKFVDSGRYYEVDSDGNVNVFEAYEDTTPGELAKNSKGEFMIESIEDLVVFSAMVNGGYSDSYITIESNQFSGSKVVLMCNLNFNSNLSYNNYASTIYNGYLGVDDTTTTLKDALTNSKYAGFIPIGNDNLKNHFKGDFDGQCHEIQNIYINTNVGMTGLFGMTSGSNIENLGITGSITTSANNTYCAGIVAIADGSLITNCYNKATVNATGTSTSVGGIASGLGGTTIKDCYNEGNITGIGWYAGGISTGAGNFKSTVINCYNTGNIVGGSMAGGILGNNGDIIENCYNTGDVTAPQYAGGITGSSSLKIYNCYNTGKISGVNYVGGICVDIGNKIVDCYNLGDVDGGEVGGIVARNQTDGAIISNCFNIGNLSCGGYDGYAGGILGRNTVTITINNSYSIGSIKENDTWAKTKGGIIGSEKGTSIINKCYYLKTEGVTQAVNGVEDSTLDVIACTNVNEITADILNANILAITHEEEWKEWKQEEIYPTFK